MHGDETMDTMSDEGETEQTHKSTEDRLADIEKKLDVLMAAAKPEPEDINDLPAPESDEPEEVKPDLAEKYSKLLAKKA